MCIAYPVANSGHTHTRTLFIFLSLSLSLVVSTRRSSEPLRSATAFLMPDLNIYLYMPTVSIYREVLKGNTKRWFGEEKRRYRMTVGGRERWNFSSQVILVTYANYFDPVRIPSFAFNHAHARVSQLSCTSRGKDRISRRGPNQKRSTRSDTRMPMATVIDSLFFLFLIFYVAFFLFFSASLFVFSSSTFHWFLEFPNEVPLQASRGASLPTRTHGVGPLWREQVFQLSRGREGTVVFDEAFAINGSMRSFLYVFLHYHLQPPLPSSQSSSFAMQEAIYITMNFF